MTLTIIHTDQFRKTVEEDGPRLETGALQINDDWPGIFIRGDDAHLGIKPMLLRLKPYVEPIYEDTLDKLLALIDEAQVT